MKKRTVNYLIRKTVRYNPTEVEKLEILLKGSANCQTISELVRDILFKRKLTLNTRNESMENTLVELGLLRNELNKIGVNIIETNNIYSSKLSTYLNSILFHILKELKREQLFFIDRLPPLRNMLAKLGFIF